MKIRNSYISMYVTAWVLLYVIIFHDINDFSENYFLQWHLKAYDVLFFLICFLSNRQRGAEPLRGPVPPRSGSERARVGNVPELSVQCVQAEGHVQHQGSRGVLHPLHPRSSGFTQSIGKWLFAFQTLDCVVKKGWKFTSKSFLYKSRVKIRN